MSLQVLLFGQQAQMAGTDAIAVDLETISRPTIAGLREEVCRLCPALRESMPASRFAVNSAFAHENSTVTCTDEIALIGLIGGG